MSVTSRFPSAWRHTAAATVCLACSGLALAAGLESPRDARVGIKLNPEKRSVVLTPQAVDVIRRAPIAHVPFELKLPDVAKRQGAAPAMRTVHPDETITLPDGRRFKAGEYFAQLNQLESQLNAAGHTLRSPSKTIQLQRSHFDLSLLQRQTTQWSSIGRVAAPKALRIQTEPLVPLSARSARVVNLTTPAGLLNSAQSMKLAPGVADMVNDEAISRGEVPLAVDTDAGQFLLDAPKPMQYRFGDDSVASAFFSAELRHQLTNDSVSLGALAHADIHLVGQAIEVLDAVALAESDEKRNHAQLHFRVAGKNLFDPYDLQGPAHIEQTRHEETGFREGVSFRIPIGPIPVAVNFGAQGRLGFDAILAADHRRVHAEFDPFLEIDGYAEAGVDIGIAGAGVYGSLVLIQDHAYVQGELGFKGRIEPQVKVKGLETYKGKAVRVWRPSSHPYIYGWLRAGNDIRMLSGNIGVYAYVYVPCVCWDLVEKKEIRHDLVTWDGIKTSVDVGTDELQLALNRPLTEAEKAELYRSRLNKQLAPVTQKLLAPPPKR